MISCRLSIDITFIYILLILHFQYTMCCSFCKTVIQKIVNFSQSPVAKRCIACLSCVLYFFDIGSDSYNGYELWVAGHKRFAALTIGIIFLPGTVFGIGDIIDGVKNRDWILIAAGITCPLWSIPITSWFQLKNIWTFSEDSIDFAKQWVSYKSNDFYFCFLVMRNWHISIDFLETLKFKMLGYIFENSYISIFLRWWICFF